jgi:hypothetical protein
MQETEDEAAHVAKGGATVQAICAQLKSPHSETMSLSEPLSIDIGMCVLNPTLHMRRFISPGLPGKLNTESHETLNLRGIVIALIQNG